jgi:GMP synthase-like glutamine amidotransferase
MAEYPERDSVLILQHQSDAGPGNLASWLHGRGLAFEVLDVPSGPLPPASARRALVVLGSRESVYDDSVPWLAAEASFVRAMLATGTPVLGLCFGAQLLASVLDRGCRDPGRRRRPGRYSGSGGRAVVRLAPGPHRAAA